MYGGGHKRQHHHAYLFLVFVNHDDVRLHRSIPNLKNMVAIRKDVTSISVNDLESPYDSGLVCPLHENNYDDDDQPK